MSTCFCQNSVCRCYEAALKNQPPAKTGWPPGLLQDDDRGLSRWLASKPDAPLHAREAAAEIEKAKP